MLRRRRGHCFETSSLLTSLLVGAGYDAYVVSGYAGQTTTHADLSYDVCPLPWSSAAAPPPPADRPCVKYRARPAKALRSRYEQTMAEREEAEAARKDAERIAEEMAERAASRRTFFPPSLPTRVVVANTLCPIWRTVREFP